MLQAAQLDCLLFDPFSLFETFLSSSEVDVGRCEIFKALMMPVMIVVADEYCDLIFQISGGRSNSPDI